MMCADYGNLREEVHALDEAGIDSFHIDIMDGRYVPNYAMSLNDLRFIRSATNRPLDVHLEEMMRQSPQSFFNLGVKPHAKCDDNKGTKDMKRLSGG